MAARRSAQPNGPERLTFGRCPNCAYARSGWPELCFTCASEVVDQIPGIRCSVCDGALRDDGSCGNPLCSWSVEARGWSFIYALAARSGVLESVLNSYKYEGVKGWAWIFARLLVGYLEENFIPGDDHGVIVPMPTFVGPGGREWDHIALVLERVAVEDRRWPLAPGAIVKTGPTRTMVGMSSWHERSDAARSELAPMLNVPDPAVVADRHVLVYDDVFTSGTTLREVSLKLQAAGALRVDGVVLARQPFRG